MGNFQAKTSSVLENLQERTVTTLRNFHVNYRESSEKLVEIQEVSKENG